MLGATRCRNFDSLESLILTLRPGFLVTTMVVSLVYGMSEVRQVMFCAVRLVCVRGAFAALPPEAPIFGWADNTRAPAA